MSQNSKYIILYSITLIIFIGIGQFKYLDPHKTIPLKHMSVSFTKSTTLHPNSSSTKPVPTATPTAVSVPPVTQPTTSVPVPAPLIVPSPSSSVSSLKPTPAVSPPETPSTTTPTTPTTSQTQTPATVPSTPTTTTTPTAPITSYSSTNWAGYIATNGYYTDISASWVVPKPTSTSSFAVDSTWIGIGGVTSGDLIQAGTMNTVSFNGKISTSAFYEMLPAASVTVQSLTVNAGDTITAYLQEGTSGQWTISISDVTDGSSYLNVLPYPSSTNTSAQWIEEDPSNYNGSLLPFDNFGSVGFTAASTTDNSNNLNLESSYAQKVSMVTPQGLPVATPSSIGSDGASFSVSRD